MLGAFLDLQFAIDSELIIFDKYFHTFKANISQFL